MSFGCLNEAPVPSLKKMAADLGLTQLLGVEKPTLVELIRMGKRAALSKRLDHGEEPRLAEVMHLLPPSTVPAGTTGQDTPNEIIPGLWLCGADYGGDEWLNAKRITHVLNTASDSTRPSNPEIVCLCIRMEDDVSYPIYPHFRPCYDFISECLSASNRVLVHCMQGVSRSATIVIAFLMIRYRLTVEQADFIVKARRNVISPNAGFYKALAKLEEELVL